MLLWRLLALGSCCVRTYCHTKADAMLLPLKCPVCGERSVEPILENVKIVAKYDGFAGDIGGLKVYRCTEWGHIFFVRTADLQGEVTKTLAS